MAPSQHLKILMVSWIDGVIAMPRRMLLAAAALPLTCFADRHNAWPALQESAVAGAAAPLAPWALIALGVVLGASAVLAPRFRAASVMAVCAALLAPLFTGAALVEFQNGEMADADEVNANFQFLQQQIDELRQLVDADGDGFTPAQGDCDDRNPAVNPNATEVCDGIDNNCSGIPDDGSAASSCGVSGACGTAVCNAGQCEVAFVPANEICRAPTSICKTAARCTGSSATCPPNPDETNGIRCGDPNGACDLGAFCQNGVCQGNNPVPPGQNCPIPLGGQCVGLNCVCPPGEIDCGDFCFSGSLCP